MRGNLMGKNFIPSVEARVKAFLQLGDEGLTRMKRYSPRERKAGSNPCLGNAFATNWLFDLGTEMGPARK